MKPAKEKALNETVLALALILIENFIGDPINKKKFKKQVLKIFKAMLLAYAGDPDFEC